VPAVALARGTGGVKERYHHKFARRFAEAGIAALLFDYRSFGTSGGEPQQPNAGATPRPIRGIAPALRALSDYLGVTNEQKGHAMTTTYGRHATSLTSGESVEESELGSITRVTADAFPILNGLSIKRVVINPGAMKQSGR
jgi:predicted alpha/beta hydrolase